MFQPVNDFDVLRSIDVITSYTPLFLQLSQPGLDKRRGIVVVRVKKAREESRGRAKPPSIVGNRPKLDEKKTSISRETTD